MRIASLLALAGLLLAACADDPPPAPDGIPDRTVVLTFDDAVRNHLTLVAPELEKRGFGATFFVSAYWLADSGHYLTWPEIGELHRRGFEIGNHTWTHAGFHDPYFAAKLPGDERLVFQALARVGVPRPTTFAWPACAFGPEARATLLAHGYLFARRGERPEHDPAREEAGPEIAYDPRRNDPMLVPSFEVGPDWTLDRFREVLGYARDGRAVVLQFHGVPDPSNPAVSVTPETFTGVLDLLAEGGYHVLALRDLARYVDPEPVTSDPLVGRHVPDLDR